MKNNTRIILINNHWKFSQLSTGSDTQASHFWCVYCSCSLRLSPLLCHLLFPCATFHHRQTYYFTLFVLKHGFEDKFLCMLGSCSERFEMWMTTPSMTWIFDGNCKINASPSEIWLYIWNGNYYHSWLLINHIYLYACIYTYMFYTYDINTYINTPSDSQLTCCELCEIRSLAVRGFDASHQHIQLDRSPSACPSMVVPPGWKARHHGPAGALCGAGYHRPALVG